MKPLPKLPLILKVLWFVPFPVLLVMVGAVELPLDGIRAYTALIYLAAVTMAFLLAASVGTVVWLSGGMIRQRT